MLTVISKTSVSVTFELNNDERFFSGHTYEVRVDGAPRFVTDRNVFTVFGLEPNRAVCVSLWENGAPVFEKYVKTEEESFLLNVRDFGAEGDGVTLDSPSIQAAIMAAPDGARVLIPEGTYLCAPIFLKSRLTVEIAKGATVLGAKEREKYPVLPGVIKDYDEERESYVSFWEGNPLPSFASLFTGINLTDVRLIGEGTIDGNAGHDNWWGNPKVKNIAWRPRLIYLRNCEGVTMEGLTVQNSPCWNIHPHECRRLKLLTLTIVNPKDSPNTDGMDPEYCQDLLVCGVRFSVGDDCVVLKSGKIFMGKKNLPPTGGVYIRNNLMEFGHGAVVIGSEISGGVRDVFIEKCLFRQTDRGLRVKTRRGRGVNSQVDNICMRNIGMERVLTPFVFNMFYYCDPDGKSEYVYTKDKLPADERTPSIGKVTAKDVDCVDSEIAAIFAYGLPESPIGEISLENVSISMAESAEPGQAAMMSFLDPIRKAGMYFNNVKKVTLKNVTLRGIEGDEITQDNVGSLTRE